MPAFGSVVPVDPGVEQVLSGCTDSITSMSAGFDVGQEVAASLGNRHGAWRFIRRFAESWLTPLSDDDGWTEADLGAAEQRLGVRLPPAIREAYALFGRRHDLTSVQDRLLGPGAERHRGLDAAAETLLEQCFARLAIPGYPLPTSADTE